jgi:PAS domain S-box-containing protein
VGNADTAAIEPQTVGSRLCPCVSCTTSVQAYRPGRFVKGSLEELQKSSRTYLASLTTAARIGIFHTDVEGRTIYVNERCAEFSGLSVEASRGFGWVDAVHPEDRARVMKDWLASVAARTEYISDYRILRPSGEIRYIHVRVAPVQDRHGEPRGFVGTAEDVTDRKLAEQALRESLAARDETQHRLQALFDYSLDAIVFADDHARYIEANPAACELLGYTREELLTRRVGEICTWNASGSFEEAWIAFLSAGEQAGEYVIRRGGGQERTVEFRAVAHVLPGTHLSILRDVTERNLAERTRLQYVKRLQLLSAIDRAMLAATSADTIASAAVAQIGQLFPAIRVSVVLFDRSKDMACVTAIWSREPTSFGIGATFPMRDDVTRTGILEGRSYVVSDLGVAYPTDLHRTLYNEGVRSYLRVPLRTPEVIGSLNISSDQLNGFGPSQLGVAQEIADGLAVAIKNARLFEEVKAASDHLAAMSKRLVELQEKERREIARELHDEIGQILTALKLQLDLMRKNVSPAVAEAVRQSELLTDDLVASVRRLALNLRPQLLDELGLGGALQAHCERFAAQTGVAVEFSADGLDGMRLPLEAESAAYRTVQESLTNVARHAEVNAATVDVRVDANALEISIRDHGRGFEPATARTVGTGLTGMQERVTILGGTLVVTSAPAKGTTVNARIPLNRPRGLEP